MFILWLLLLTVVQSELILLSGRVLDAEIRVPCGSVVRGTGYDTVVGPNRWLLGDGTTSGACNITIERLHLANVVQPSTALVPAADRPRYFFVRLHNVTMTRCAISLSGSAAIGGELVLDRCRLDHTRLTLSYLVVANVTHSEIDHSRLTIAHNDMARVAHNRFVDSKLQLVTKSEEGRLLPHLIDVFLNDVHRSRASLRCAQTHLLTHAHGGGLAAFAMANDTAIGERCHIEWAMPPTYAIPVRPPAPLFYTL